jgi:hypothetical protein
MIRRCEIMFNVSAEMRPVIVASMLLLAAVPITDPAPPASAQALPDLKARCTQLTSFYDRYGASRSENTDGVRNIVRISAGIDCDRGNEVGVVAMEDLLLRKKFDIPPPVPAAPPVAQAPLPRSMRSEQ